MDSKNISDIFCPSCGAPARFDIINQQYKCSHCDGTVGIREALKEKLGFRKLHQEKMKQAAKDYKLYSASCSGCGATVVFEENESMTTCAFCGKSLVRKEYLNDEELPELIIPFKITEDEAKQIAKEWCEANSSKIEAKHFSEKIPELKGFYLPYELIRGPINCETARQNSCYYHCKANVDKEFINRSKQLDNLLLDAMEPFELSDLVEFDFAYVAGQRVKTSDITVDQLDKRIFSELSTNLKPGISKTLHTNLLRVNVDTSSILRMPVLLPVYYVCDGNFIAAINGQTGKVSVKAESNSYVYYIPWWINAFLSTFIMCLLAFVAFTSFGWDFDNSICTTGMLGIVLLIITLCFFSDTESHSFREIAPRKIFTSKGGPYRRNSNNHLEKEKKPLPRPMLEPVFFYNMDGVMKPAELSFLPSFLFMLISGLIVLFLPVIIALFLNGFNFEQLTLGGSAVWFCVFIPVVPIYILKFGIVYLFDTPTVHQIMPNGSRKKYKSEKPALKYNLVKELMKEAIQLPGCLFAGFGLMCFFMCCYLTAFGFGDENEKDKQCVKTAQVASSTKTIAKQAANKQPDDNQVVNNQSTTDNTAAPANKPIEIDPMRHEGTIIENLQSKELFNFYWDHENAYYVMLHFTQEKQNDWVLFSYNRSNTRRDYLYYQTSDKTNKQHIASVEVYNTGFDVFDANNSLIWSIESKNGEFLLKKGKDKELAYRMYKIKSNSETFNCYMMADPNGRKCALSLCKGKLIVMDGATQETVFYCAKPKLNKDNEPALAFPVLFNMKEMSPQLQGIIAIELSQLE